MGFEHILYEGDDYYLRQQDNTGSGNLAVFVIFILIMCGLFGLIFPVIGLITLSSNEPLSGFIYLFTGTLLLNIFFRGLGLIIARAKRVRKEALYNTKEDTLYPLTLESIIKFIIVSLLIALIAGSVSYINAQTIMFPLLGFVVWLMLLWFMPKWFKTHPLGMRLMHGATQPSDASHTTNDTHEKPLYDPSNRYWLLPKSIGSLKVADALLDASGNEVITMERMKHGHVSVFFHHRQDGKIPFYLESPSQPDGECQLLNDANEIIATIGPIMRPSIQVSFRKLNYEDKILKGTFLLYREHRETFLNDEPFFTIKSEKYNKKRAVAIDIHQPDQRDMAIVLAIAIIYRGQL